MTGGVEGFTGGGGEGTVVALELTEGDCRIRPLRSFILQKTSTLVNVFHDSAKNRDFHGTI